LSGLSGEEMMMFIDSFPETGKKNMITSSIVPLGLLKIKSFFLNILSRTMVWSFCYAGLKPAAFAALVPNSANKPLQELIEEVKGDHETLVCIYFGNHSLSFSMSL